MKKAWFYEQLFSEVVMIMVKDKKIHHRRYNFNQNKFYALHEVGKSNVTNGFQRIGGGLYFFAPFSFSLSLSIGKWSSLGKIWGPEQLPDAFIYNLLKINFHILIKTGI